MTTAVKEITNMEDVIDVRDVIARVEELEGNLADDEPDDAGKLDPDLEDDRAELKMLAGLLEELRGNGGDEEWRDAWYPITLIRDSHFQDHAQELAEDIGAVNTDANWPNSCIDWAWAARELQMDYSSVEFDGVTFWYR